MTFFLNESTQARLDAALLRALAEMVEASHGPLTEDVRSRVRVDLAHRADAVRMVVAPKPNI